jgi:hypothetical protein
MPCVSVSTVEPSVALEAVLTTAVDEVDWLEDEEVLAPPEEEPVPELLPHAASVSDAARAGRRDFEIRRIGTPSRECSQSGMRGLTGESLPH